MLERSFPQICNKIENYENNGSDWVVKNIEFLDIHCVKYAPLKGSCPGGVQLPRSLVTKRALVNVENYDEECFKWAVLAGLFRKEHNPSRISQYRQHEHELIFWDNAFPMALDDIPRFETLNNVSINVLEEADGILTPIQMTSNKRDRHVDLLLHHEHYVLIRNLDRLLSQQRGCRCRKFFATFV